MNDLLKAENQTGWERCSRCGKTSEDVHERDDQYAQEIGHDEEATHIVCDSCDHENRMDI